DTLVRNYQYAKNSHNMVLVNPLLFYNLIISDDLGKSFGEGPINTDNRPLLEFSAPKLMYLRDDPAIKEHLIKETWLKPETRKIVLDINSNIDSQIDLAVLNLSFDILVRDMVDLSQATPEQKMRYTDILISYCAENVVNDFSFIGDPELQKRCITAQIEFLKKKINTVREKDDLYCFIGNMYGLLKMHSEAISYFNLAIETNPSNFTAYFKLGNVLEEQNLLDESIRMYSEAVRINPIYVQAYHNWGNILVRRNNLEEAAEKYRRALALNPEAAPSHLAIGEVLKKLGNTEEANRHLEEGARLMGKTPGELLK
ncbi:MAG: tetratricopeptide repeat protein, partial [Candidatus Latescibacterota bacterium]